MARPSHFFNILQTSQDVQRWTAAVAKARSEMDQLMFTGAVKEGSAVHTRATEIYNMNGAAGHGHHDAAGDPEKPTPPNNTNGAAGHGHHDAVGDPELHHTEQNATDTECSAESFGSANSDGEPSPMRRAALLAANGNEVCADDLVKHLVSKGGNEHDPPSAGAMRKLAEWMERKQATQTSMVPTSARGVYIDNLEHSSGQEQGTFPVKPLEDGPSVADETTTKAVLPSTGETLNDTQRSTLDGAAVSQPLVKNNLDDMLPGGGKSAQNCPLDLDERLLEGGSPTQSSTISPSACPQGEVGATTHDAMQQGGDGEDNTEWLRKVLPLVYTHDPAPGLESVLELLGSNRASYEALCRSVNVTPKPMPTPPRQRNDGADQRSKNSHSLPAGPTTPASQPKPCAQRPGAGGGSRRTQRRRAQRNRRKASHHTSTGAAGPSVGAPRHTNKHTYAGAAGPSVGRFATTSRRPATQPNGPATTGRCPIAQPNGPAATGRRPTTKPARAGVVRMAAHLITLTNQVLLALAELHTLLA